MDFIQDQQGRHVFVRWAVAATCIKILSQAAQRIEDLIACSVLLSVIYFCIVFAIQPCLRKPSKTQWCIHWYGGRNVLHMIYGYKRHTCNIVLVITHY